MTLDARVYDMHAAHNVLLKTTKTKTDDWKKFDLKFKALDKAKNEQEFKKQKKECEKLLSSVLAGIMLDDVNLDSWESAIKDARASLELEKKSSARIKQEYEFNLKKCKAYNEHVRKFNAELEAAKKRGERKDEKPKNLIPEEDVAAVLQRRQDLLANTEKTITEHERLIKQARDFGKQELTTFKEEEKNLKAKEFKAQPVKGKKH
jgi:hypothetical protein